MNSCTVTPCTGDRTSGRRHLPLLVAGLLLATLWAPGAAYTSEVYRTVDEHGNVMFTDQAPQDDAQAEELDEINVGQPIQVRERREERDGPDDEGEGADEDADAAYDGVEIVFPPAEEATRRVTGEVPVRVSLQPDDAELATGHRVRILVDGESAGEAPATEVMVGPLIPGPHRLRAEVVTAEGETIVRSAEIRFHLIRQTANN